MNTKVHSEISDQATGVVENVTGMFFIIDNSGKELNKLTALETIEEGKSIFIEDAGAGSYLKVFKDLLDFEEVKVLIDSSSCGDWCFAVKNDCLWYTAVQSNLYPSSGFSYTVDFTTSFETIEEVYSFINEF